MSDTSNPFSGFSDEDRREFAESSANLIMPLIRAGSRRNWESRLVRRAFLGSGPDPSSIVDEFGKVTDEDRAAGVTTVGHYFFDDEEYRYIGPFVTRLEALGAAGENIRQITKRLPTAGPG